MLRNYLRRAVVQGQRSVHSQVQPLQTAASTNRRLLDSPKFQLQPVNSRRYLFGGNKQQKAPPAAEKAAEEPAPETPVDEDEPVEAADSALAEQLKNKEEELEKLTAEFKEKDTERLRQIAEVLNSQKRNNANHQKALKYAHKKFAKDVLSVYDDLQRALDHIPKNLVQEHDDIKKLVEGIQMTQGNLEKSYSRHGINRIPAEIGSKFDPNLHDAAFHLPVGAIPNVDADCIGAVQEVGFTIHEQVLRPCKVGVIQ